MIGATWPRALKVSLRSAIRVFAGPFAASHEFLFGLRDQLGQADFQRLGKPALHLQARVSAPGLDPGDVAAINSGRSRQLALVPAPPFAKDANGQPERVPNLSHVGEATPSVVHR